MGLVRDGRQSVTRTAVKSDEIGLWSRYSDATAHTTTRARAHPAATTAHSEPCQGTMSRWVRQSYKREQRI